MTLRKKLSIKGLADYMTSSASKQRSIIRQYKYPDEDEGRAKIHYYREARDLIAAYHSASRDRRWLESEALRLQSLASLSPPRRRTRLAHNARAVSEYAHHFGEQDFEVLDDLNLSLVYGDVLVSVRPDLYVMDDEKEKVLKLEFSAQPPTSEVVKIISQGMFEAALDEGLDLKSAQVLYLDVPRGRIHKGARLGAHMRRNIEAACATISAVWPSI